MVNFEKEKDKFIKFLKNQKNYSINTIINYEEDLNNYNKYLKGNNIFYNKVEYTDIRKYYNYLNDLGYNKNSISRKISSIRSFYKYLVINEIVLQNPFSLASLPKKDKLLPKFLYYNDLESLFEIPDIDTFIGVRNRLILELLYATGIRVGELENIKLEDFDFKNMTIKVLGKGNKERIVYYGEYAKEILDIYLLKREVFLDNKFNKYLLINNKKDRLTARGIRLIFNKLVDKSEIKSNISPHVIRHTFATHLLSEGCDITTVQTLLGHTSLRSTQVYTHFTDEQIRNTYLHSHPRAIMKEGNNYENK